MTKKEACFKYYSAMFEFVETILLIVIDIFAIVTLFIGQYYAFSGLFIAFNVLAVKIGIEQFLKMKNDTIVKELKPEEMKEGRKMYFEALSEGVRIVVIAIIILSGMFFCVINSITGEAIRLILIILVAFLARICLTALLNNIQKDYLLI